MLPYLLLFTISAVTAQSCDYRYDGRLYFRRPLLETEYDDTKLQDAPNLATNLVYDRSSGALLFTLVNLDSLEFETDETLMDGYIYYNGKSRKVQNVDVYYQGQAAAVDSKNGIVYLASNRGLHILNYIHVLTGTDNYIHVLTGTDKVSRLPYLVGNNIVQVVKPAHKDVLYFVTFPEYTFFVYNITTKEAERMNPISFAFFCVVDGQGNIYFVNRNKNVEMLLKDFHKSIQIRGLRNKTIRAIGVDDADRAVLAANDGLYHLRPDNVIPKKLMNLDFIPGGIAFKGDTIFISTHDTIYEFIPC